MRITTMTSTAPQYPRIAGAVAALLFAAAAACSESPVAPPVQVEKPLHAIEVTPGSATVLETYMTQLEVSFRAADGTALAAKPVTWSSGDTTIASVTPYGAVHARRPGAVTITAEHAGRVGVAHVVVEALRVTRITLSQNTVNVTFGQTVQVGATTGSQDGGYFPAKVTWTTSDPEIASVDSAGRITGGLAGTASVKARVGDVVAEVVVYSQGPAVPGRWRLSIQSIQDETSVCSIHNVVVEVTRSGNWLGGGTSDASHPSVECVPTGNAGEITTPFPPHGPLTGGVLGTRVTLNFALAEWYLNGTFVSPDRIEGDAVYFGDEQGENGAPVMRQGRFVLVRN
jgi:hypothetical protein